MTERLQSVLNVSAICLENKTNWDLKIYLAKKLDSGAAVCKKNTEIHYQMQIVAKKKEAKFNGNVARCMVFETAFPDPYVS